MLGWVLFIRISVIIIAYCAFMIQQDGAFFKYMYMCLPVLKIQTSSCQNNLQGVQEKLKKVITLFDTKIRLNSYFLLIN